MEREELVDFLTGDEERKRATAEKKRAMTAEKIKSCERRESIKLTFVVKGASDIKLVSLNLREPDSEMAVQAHEAESTDSRNPNTKKENEMKAAAMILQHGAVTGSGEPLFLEGTKGVEEALTLLRAQARKHFASSLVMKGWPTREAIIDQIIELNDKSLCKHNLLKEHGLYRVPLANGFIIKAKASETQDPSPSSNKEAGRPI